jgi:hypothetical protein
MPLNPYIAMFSIGGFIAFAIKPSPSWETIAIGLLCVVACGVAKLLWKPPPPPKKSLQDGTVKGQLALNGSPSSGDLPSGTVLSTPPAAQFANVPNQS